MPRISRRKVWRPWFVASLAADESKLDEKINLNLREAAAANVLDSFQHILSVEVEIDTAITGSFSIQLDNVSVRTTLNAICESIGCEWQLDDGILRFSAIEAPAAEEASTTIAFQPLNLDLKDAQAADVFRSLAQILEAELILDPAVNGKFSIQLDQAGLE